MAALVLAIIDQLFYLFSSFIMDYLLIKPNQETTKISLAELLSQHEKTLLYFYPKDNTP